MFEKYKKFKFEVGDRVQTNIHYVEGFGGSHVAPPDMKRKKDLEIVAVSTWQGDDFDFESQNLANGKSSPYIYTCRSKTKEYEINGCFLEKMKEGKGE